MKRRDVIFVVLGIIVFFFTAVLSGMPRLRKHVESVNCGNYMASIGIAVRIWSDDHTNCLPVDFLSMSNELCTPKILICPGDHARRAAPDWASFTLTNCSYQIVTPGATWNNSNVFFRCQIHSHLGYADGTVFDGTRRRTKVFW
jgi:hypothetical protein